MEPKKLAKQIISEATGDDVVETLTTQAMEAALAGVDFEVLKSDFEAAKRQYYTALRNFLASKLNVSAFEVGRYVTTVMKKQFEDYLQKAFEALQPNTKGKDFSDPQILKS